MPEPSGPKGIRQHERFTCRLPAQITIAPAHDEQLRPIRTTTDTDGLSATVVDCGRGGLGLNSTTFLPKQAQVTVRVCAGDVTISAPLRVMRSQMVDRQPTYYLGCALASPTPEQQAELARLIEHVKANPGETPN